MNTVAAPYVCIHCQTPVASLYIEYQNTSNNSLLQCPHCGLISDVYQSHTAPILLVDLLLFKARVYRHLLFNRGSVRTEKGRWESSWRLGALVVGLDAFIRCAHIGKPESEKPFKLFAQTLAYCLLETISLQASIAVSIKMIDLFSLKGSKRPKLSLLPLTLFYSSLPTLFLLAISSLIWHDEYSRTTSLADAHNPLILSPFLAPIMPYLTKLPSVDPNISPKLLKVIMKVSRLSRNNLRSGISKVGNARGWANEAVLRKGVGGSSALVGVAAFLHFTSISAMDVPYIGEAKLVLCIDVGTTQTAVSILHLLPGVLPKLRIVSRWPGDNTSSKIPSLILYKNGVAKAFGAEAANDESILDQASEENWETARWFKLGLHPSSMQPPAYSARESVTPSRPVATMEIPPLPTGVTLSKVYEDWFGYIARTTQNWFTSNVPDGDTIWEKMSPSMVYVVAHPNAYTLTEQSFLKSALLKAVKLPSTVEEDRVVFVTEGEASVHFSLNYSGNSSSDWLTPGTNFAVVDAGGSTVDTCVYVVEEVMPKLKLREAKTSGCVQAGAIFPTRDARAIITEKLKKSKYNKSEYLDTIMAQFDTKTKCKFSSAEENHVIKFGFDKDTDKSCGISRGRLTLTGSEVERAFAPTMAQIMSSVEQQLEGCQVKHILLTGGFGESPHLQICLRNKYEPLGMQVISADEPSKKAVAEGAALFHVKDSVVARATRFAFGSSVCRLEKDVRGEIAYRKVFKDLDGEEYVEGGWSRILEKGEVVESEQMIRKEFFVLRTNSFKHSTKLWVDKLGIHGDGWMVDEYGKELPNFEVVCTVEADLSPMCTGENLKYSYDQGRYYELYYEMALFFGSTSLKACLIWKENGVEKRGPASVVPSTYF